MLLRLPQISSDLVCKSMPTLWRYLSLEKFQWLLQDGGLFFSKASCFDDAEEGAFSLENYKCLAEMHGYNFPSGIDLVIQEVQQIDKERTYVSCWYRGERTSDFMWDSYAKNGVAIKTTWFKIYEAIPQELKEVIGSIDCSYRYKQSVSELSNPYRYKDVNYTEEKECRFIFSSVALAVKTNIKIDDLPMLCIGDQLIDAQIGSHLVQRKGNGAVIKMDLSQIIDAIYLPVNASASFETEVNALIHKNNYSFRVRRCNAE